MVCVCFAQIKYDFCTHIVAIRQMPYNSEKGQIQITPQVINNDKIICWFLFYWLWIYFRLFFSLGNHWHFSYVVNSNAFAFFFTDWPRSQNINNTHNVCATRMKFWWVIRASIVNFPSVWSSKIEKLRKNWW